MKSRLAGWPACALLLWWTASGLAQAGAIENYRYFISTCGAEPEFSQPIASDRPGTYYAVERDSQERLVGVTTKRNGRTLFRVVYHYRAGQWHATSTDDYSGTGHIGRSEMRYDTNGRLIRVDNFDSAGALTGYKTLENAPQGVTESLHTAEGHLTSLTTFHCAAGGRVVSSTLYLNPDNRNSYQVYDYDEVTGLSSLHRQYGGGQLKFVFADLYDSNGDQTSEVISEPDGTVIAMEQYSDALIAVRQYVDPWPEGGLELRFHYSGMIWPDEVAVHYRGSLVCRLAFQMTSDGTVQKTLALGPDGRLWAEYPDQAVYQVNRDGTAADGVTSVLHRTGSWW